MLSCSWKESWWTEFGIIPTVGRNSIRNDLCFVFLHIYHLTQINFPSWELWTRDQRKNDNSGLLFRKYFSLCSIVHENLERLILHQCFIHWAVLFTDKKLSLHILDNPVVTILSINNNLIRRSRYDFKIGKQRRKQWKNNIKSQKKSFEKYDGWTF